MLRIATVLTLAGWGILLAIHAWLMLSGRLLGYFAVHVIVIAFALFAIALAVVACLWRIRLAAWTSLGIAIVGAAWAGRTAWTSARAIIFSSTGHIHRPGAVTCVWFLGEMIVCLLPCFWAPACYNAWTLMAR
jgi:hypothetical protein